MCIQDWRAGRLIRVNMLGDLASMPVAGRVPRNQQRVGISFWALGNPTIEDPISGAQAHIIQVNVDGAPCLSFWINPPSLHLTLKDHGDLPTRQFDLSYDGGDFNVFATEYFMPEEMIQAGLDEFSRTYKGYK